MNSDIVDLLIIYTIKPKVQTSLALSKVCVNKSIVEKLKKSVSVLGDMVAYSKCEPVDAGVAHWKSRNHISTERDGWPNTVAQYWLSIACCNKLQNIFQRYCFTSSGFKKKQDQYQIVICFFKNSLDTYKQTFYCYHVHNLKRVRLYGIHRLGYNNI